MDAFSLALSIGTLGLTKKEIITLSSIVGAFHFFMPLIGTMVGRIFVSNVHVDANILLPKRSTPFLNLIPKT